MDSPCILGAGGNGVVFRVTANNNIADGIGACGSSSCSEPAALGTKALKVVVGDSEAIFRLNKEWEAAKSARALCDSVVSVGAIYCGADFGAYTMDEVGSAVEISSVEQKQALFILLLELHIRGVIHGDARVQNIIVLPTGKLMWIDFANAFIYSEFSAMVANDFRVLFESLFAQKPSQAQIEAYESCVAANQISAEAWEALGVV